MKLIFILFLLLNPASIEDFRYFDKQETSTGCASNPSAGGINSQTITPLPLADQTEDDNYSAQQFNMPIVSPEIIGVSEDTIKIVNNSYKGLPPEPTATPEPLTKFIFVLILIMSFLFGFRKVLEK